MLSLQSAMQIALIDLTSAMQIALIDLRSALALYFMQQQNVNITSLVYRIQLFA